MHQLSNKLTPYLHLMRLHQPVGIGLLLWPCWWGILLASEGGIPWWPLIGFTIGAVLMRGAGCIVNDILDRKIDAQVERTRTRPLASGEVTVKQALLFLLLPLFISAVILFTFNTKTILLGIGSLVLVGLYPLMKRITYWPQLFLGLTFNWGALMGWMAVRGEMEMPAILLYVAGIFWTLGYDTIYAHQDKEDDELIGVKSTALKLGERTPLWVRRFYSLTAILLFLAAFHAHVKDIFYPIWLAAVMQLIWQVYTLNCDDKQNCKTRFRSNNLFGLIVTVGLLVVRW